MRKNTIIALFIIISSSIFAWMGLEDESITGYPSLFASLLSRALEENSYFVDNTSKEISIINKSIKRNNDQDIGEIESSHILLYKEGKLLEDKIEGNDGNTKSKIIYSYNEKGLIKGAMSYEGENSLVKRSEYRYNEDGTKIDYTSYDNTERIRVKHKFIYSTSNDNKMVIKEEKIYNSAGINVLTIKYEYDNKNNLKSSIFFDYNGDYMRKQDYEYNTSGKVVKFTALNELNDKDGEFEYVYNENNKIEQILFKRPFNDEGVVAFKFNYDKDGVVIEKNTFLIKEAFGEKVEQKLNQSILDYKLLKDEITNKEITASLNENSEKNKKELAESNKTQKIEKLKINAKSNEIKERIALFYKESTFKKQNKAGKDFYGVYDGKKNIIAYLFVSKNFGYSGEILTYVLIDLTGAVKDVYISKESKEKKDVVQLLKSKDWFSKFNKINVKNTDVSRRDFKEKIDGVAGATVTSDATIICVWKAIELYNNITSSR